MLSLFLGIPEQSMLSIVEPSFGSSLRLRTLILVTLIRARFEFASRSLLHHRRTETLVLVTSILELISSLHLSHCHVSAAGAV